MARALRITLDHDLPLRARPPAPETLAKMFGGEGYCVPARGICSSKDGPNIPRVSYLCCPGLTCKQPAVYTEYWQGHCRAV